jgi:hypothetical protein
MNSPIAIDLFNTVYDFIFQHPNLYNEKTRPVASSSIQLYYFPTVSREFDMVSIINPMGLFVKSPAEIQGMG